ncbi:hypothetical protein IWQ56_006113, partial [Coemansia nantahalensis]
MNDARSSVRDTADVYRGINAFVSFVADGVKFNVPEHRYESLVRGILPVGNTDVAPDGTDDRPRDAHMLTGCLECDPASYPNYGAALCLVEARFDPDNQKQAYEQLIMHSRNIYAVQPHRRFLWGLTVCGTYVRACLLSNDNIYASKVVDVSGPEGREHFVELLVNWSMCESPRAGYDPTIWRNDARDKWMINVFDGGATRTYHELGICVGASSLFGRHTRCFIGKARGAEDSEKVLIKDCWPHVAEDAAGGQPNEITFLREIREKLCDVLGLAGKYPVLEAGGIVQVKGKDADMVDDTTTAATADLELAKPVLLRKHMRIAMRPIGVSLNMVDSPDELIIAVCDAMEAHTAIVRRCGILHRDISFNNILVSRTGGK